MTLLSSSDVEALVGGGISRNTIYQWSAGRRRPGEAGYKRAVAILERDPWDGNYYVPDSKQGAGRPLKALPKPLPPRPVYVAPADPCATVETCLAHRYHGCRFLGTCRRGTEAARIDAEGRTNGISQDPLAF